MWNLCNLENYVRMEISHYAILLKLKITYQTEMCPSLPHLDYQVKMAWLSHCGHSSASAVWTQNKSISRKQNPGPLSPFCSRGRNQWGGHCASSVLSLLTNFILWGWLHHTGKRVRHWPKLPNLTAAAGLPYCSTMITRRSVRATVYFHLKISIRAVDCMGRLCSPSRIWQICEETETDQNRWTQVSFHFPSPLDQYCLQVSVARVSTPV